MAFIYSQFRDGAIPDIYLQDPKYFDKYKDEILKIWGEGIGHEDWVAIHIRRGDYVNNPFYVDLLQTDYYQRARELFPNEKFLVFSDDIEECKKLLPNQENVYFVQGKSEEQDLKLMASCKGIIMANSSFSWWGAYLSKAKIVYPKAWFVDGVQRVGFPNDWIAL